MKEMVATIPSIDLQDGRTPGVSPSPEPPPAPTPEALQYTANEISHLITSQQATVLDCNGAVISPWLMGMIASDLERGGAVVIKNAAKGRPGSIKARLSALEALWSALKDKNHTLGYNPALSTACDRLRDLERAERAGDQEIEAGRDQGDENDSKQGVCQ